MSFLLSRGHHGSLGGHYKSVGRGGGVGVCVCVCVCVSGAFEDQWGVIGAQWG